MQEVSAKGASLCPMGERLRRAGAGGKWTSNTERDVLRTMTSALGCVPWLFGYGCLINHVHVHMYIAVNLSSQCETQCKVPISYVQVPMRTSVTDDTVIQRLLEQPKFKRA